MTRVAIAGGGIAGLASAHFLLRAGCIPVIFEAANQLGGLGTYFEHAGFSFERFYHVILDSDADLLELIDELGLAAAGRTLELDGNAGVDQPDDFILQQGKFHSVFAPG